jgi:hypothetical protein
MAPVQLASWISEPRPVHTTAINGILKILPIGPSVALCDHPLVHVVTVEKDDSYQTLVAILRQYINCDFATH